eukprot:g177.t1
MLKIAQEKQKKILADASHIAAMEAKKCQEEKKEKSSPKKSTKRSKSKLQKHMKKEKHIVPLLGESVNDLVNGVAEEVNELDHSRRKAHDLMTNEKSSWDSDEKHTDEIEEKIAAEKTQAALATKELGKAIVAMQKAREDTVLNVSKIFDKDMNKREAEEKIKPALAAKQLENEKLAVQKVQRKALSAATTEIKKMKEVIEKTRKDAVARAAEVLRCRLENEKLYKRIKEVEKESELILRAQEDILTKVSQDALNLFQTYQKEIQQLVAHQNMQEMMAQEKLQKCKEMMQKAQEKAVAKTSKSAFQKLQKYRLKMEKRIGLEKARMARKNEQESEASAVKERFREKLAARKLKELTKSIDTLIENTLQTCSQMTTEELERRRKEIKLEEREVLNQLQLTNKEMNEKMKAEQERTALLCTQLKEGIEMSKNESKNLLYRDSEVPKRISEKILEEHQAMQEKIRMEQNHTTLAKKKLNNSQKMILKAQKHIVGNDSEIASDNFQKYCKEMKNRVAMEKDRATKAAKQLKQSRKMMRKVHENSNAKISEAHCSQIRNQRKSIKIRYNQVMENLEEAEKLSQNIQNSSLTLFGHFKSLFAEIRNAASVRIENDLNFHARMILKQILHLENMNKDYEHVFLYTKKAEAILQRAKQQNLYGQLKLLVSKVDSSRKRIRKELLNEKIKLKKQRENSRLEIEKAQMKAKLGIKRHSKHKKKEASDKSEKFEKSVELLLKEELDEIRRNELQDFMSFEESSESLEVAIWHTMEEMDLINDIVEKAFEDEEFRIEKAIQQAGEEFKIAVDEYILKREELSKLLQNAIEAEQRESIIDTPIKQANKKKSRRKKLKSGLSSLFRGKKNALPTSERKWKNSSLIQGLLKDKEAMEKSFKERIDLAEDNLNRAVKELEEINENTDTWLKRELDILREKYRENVESTDAAHKKFADNKAVAVESLDTNMVDLEGRIFHSTTSDAQRRAAEQLQKIARNLEIEKERTRKSEIMGKITVDRARRDAYSTFTQEMMRANEKFPKPINNAHLKDDNEMAMEVERGKDNSSTEMDKFKHGKIGKDNQVVTIEPGNHTLTQTANEKFRKPIEFEEMNELKDNEIVKKNQKRKYENLKVPEEAFLSKEVMHSVVPVIMHNEMNSVEEEKNKNITFKLPHEAFLSKKLRQSLAVIEVVSAMTLFNRAKIDTKRKAAPTMTVINSANVDTKRKDSMVVSLISPRSPSNELLHHRDTAIDDLAAIMQQKPYEKSTQSEETKKQSRKRLKKKILEHYPAELFVMTISLNGNEEEALDALAQKYKLNLLDELAERKQTGIDETKETVHKKKLEEEEGKDGIDETKETVHKKTLEEKQGKGGIDETKETVHKKKLEEEEGKDGIDETKETVHKKTLEEKQGKGGIDETKENLQKKSPEEEQGKHGENIMLTIPEHAKKSKRNVEKIRKAKDLLFNDKDETKLKVLISDSKDKNVNNDFVPSVPKKVSMHEKYDFQSLIKMFNAKTEELHRRNLNVVELESGDFYEILHGNKTYDEKHHRVLSLKNESINKPLKDDTQMGAVRELSLANVPTGVKTRLRKGGLLAPKKQKGKKKARLRKGGLLAPKKQKGKKDFIEDKHKKPNSKQIVTVDGGKDFIEDKHKKPNSKQIVTVDGGKDFIEDKHKKPNSKQIVTVDGGKDFIEDKHKKPNSKQIVTVDGGKDFIEDKHKKPNSKQIVTVDEGKDFIEDKHEKPNS